MKKTFIFCIVICKINKLGGRQTFGPHVFYKKYQMIPLTGTQVIRKTYEITVGGHSLQCGNLYCRRHVNIDGGATHEILQTKRISLHQLRDSH